jgi:hypothetical protein
MTVLFVPAGGAAAIACNSDFLKKSPCLVVLRIPQNGGMWDSCSVGFFLGQKKFPVGFPVCHIVTPVGVSRHAPACRDALSRPDQLLAPVTQCSSLADRQNTTETDAKRHIEHGRNRACKQQYRDLNRLATAPYCDRTKPPRKHLNPSRTPDSRPPTTDTTWP